jgi:hypothetical protein
MDTTNPTQAAPIMVLDAGPAVAGWLHLPSLHAKLLPLAQAAGHDKLHLSCECNGAEPSDYTYLASASGASANSFRRYISVFEPGGGYSWHDFERVLTAKLHEQIAYRAMLKGGQHNA